MIRYVRGFFGLGLGVEKHGVCDDKDTSIRWLNWHVKVFCGPLIATWNMAGRKRREPRQVPDGCLSVGKEKR